MPLSRAGAHEPCCATSAPDSVACGRGTQLPLTFPEESPVLSDTWGALGTDTAPDPGGPCHAASLSAVWRPPVAARR